MTSPYISIGMHGHWHWDSRNLSIEKFKENIQLNREYLQSHQCYIPYFALPYGKYTEEQANYLKKNEIIVLLSNGGLIHNNFTLLSRYCLDGLEVSNLKLY